MLHPSPNAKCRSLFPDRRIVLYDESHNIETRHVLIFLLFVRFAFIDLSISRLNFYAADRYIKNSILSCGVDLEVIPI